MLSMWSGVAWRGDWQAGRSGKEFARSLASVCWSAVWQLSGN